MPRHVFAFLFYLFGLIVADDFTPLPSDHAGDAAALIDLFVATRGDVAWMMTTNWLVNGTSICDWTGISCDYASLPHRVQQIDLTWNMVSDFGQRIPDSIGNLTSLTTLYLSQNFLSSTVPSSIGKLVNLQYLDLSLNTLNGSFPDSINLCTNLLKIDIMENNFLSVPSSFNLPLLTYFNLGKNSAMISPPLFQDCPPNLKSLQFISFQYSIFRSTSEFSWLCNCTSLTEINLSGLKGPFPDWLADCLPGLTSATIQYNKIVGSLPNSICRLNQLTELHLAYNSISGSIPECIGNLTQLRTLELQYNNFDGSIPVSLGSLSQLGLVNFDQNQLTGSIPDSITNLSQIEFFSASRNLLTGTLDLFSALPSLTTLYMQNNAFTGTITPNFGLNFNLRQFYVNNNRLTGSLPAELMRYNSTMTMFDLSNNFLSGTLPSTLPENMNIFSLDNNAFDGEFPDWLCNHGRQMNIFNLASNRLRGTLPSCLGSLDIPVLSTFNVSSNLMSGTIPDSIAFLNSGYLQIVDLHGNSFYGTIPQNMSRMKLTFLDLSDNQFGGTFPSVFGKMITLSRLDISGNQFTGSLDDIFQSVEHLPLFFNVSRNKLGGLVSRLNVQCNASVASACPSVAILDARGNHFDCPFPQYSQLDTLFLRDACSPPYTTFAIYSGSLVGALLVLVLIRYVVLRQFGSASSSLVAPSYAPSRWKWMWHGVVYILSLVTLGSDVYTMYTIGEYLLSRIDNCALVNSYSMWKYLTSITQTTLFDAPEFSGLSFPSAIHLYIQKLNRNNFGQFSSDYLNVFDTANRNLLGNAVGQFSSICDSIQSGCALRHSIQYPSDFATECYMAFDDQAPFGGTSHRLFAYICIAIVTVRALVELGKASVVLWSWLQGRIVGARWSIDFVGASLLSPMFVLSLGGDWSEYFKVVVSHEASYWSLAWRVVHQSLLCSVPLLCANLYFLFSVSQSGLQLLNMFSVLSACVSIPLTIVRAVLAWRSLDASYSTSDVAQVLEFTQNVLDVARLDASSVH